MPFATTVWMPFVFSVIVNVICFVTYLSTQSSSPGSMSIWMIPFLSFLLLSVHAACLTDKETRDYIKTLEARIQRLEADQSAAS
jgi:hypothetical protein